MRRFIPLIAGLCMLAVPAGASAAGPACNVAGSLETGGGGNLAQIGGTTTGFCKNAPQVGIYVSLTIQANQDTSQNLGNNSVSTFIVHDYLPYHSWTYVTWYVQMHSPSGWSSWNCSNGWHGGLIDADDAYCKFVALDQVQ